MMNVRPDDLIATNKAISTAGANASREQKNCTYRKGPPSIEKSEVGSRKSNAFGYFCVYC